MRIKRYLKLFWAFFKFSFQAETEFRSNLIFWSFENILWMILGITSIHLIFGHIEAIAGWSKNEVFLVLFIALLFHDLCWTLLFRNLGNFSRLIRHGELDNTLLKPVNPRFLLSFRTLEFDHYTRIALEIFLIYRYTILTTGYFSFFNFIIFSFLFICGFLIFYSLFFALTVTNIWFVNLANLINFFHTIKNMGGKPIAIFKIKRGFLYFFSFVLPVGYIATFPAEALMGETSVIKIILAPILVFVFLWGSQRFFNFALKYYSSASS